MEASKHYLVETEAKSKGANKGNVFVMFDLESTGLGTNTAQIIQIAALPLGNCDQPSFNRYIFVLENTHLPNLNNKQ